MVDHTDLENIIAGVKARMAGHTQYENADEVLVDEIERLREMLFHYGDQCGIPADEMRKGLLL